MESFLYLSFPNRSKVLSARLFRPGRFEGLLSDLPLGPKRRTGTARTSLRPFVLQSTPSVAASPTPNEGRGEAAKPMETGFPDSIADALWDYHICPHSSLKPPLTVGYCR